MPSVVISDEQREQIQAAGGPVDLVDNDGAVVGRAEPAVPPDFPHPTAEEVADMLARLDRPGPRYITAEVLAYARQRAGQ